MTEDQGKQQEDGGFKPITSQEQFDTLIRERIERAKRSAVPDDYDDLKERAARLEEAEAKGKAELAGMTERAQAAEAERDELRHAAEVEAWKAAVSSETGVPSTVLRGDSLDEIKAHAEAIKASMPVYPQVREQGPASGAPMGKEQILQIKDARARKAAILANLDQF
jgi:hypothetical protein